MTDQAKKLTVTVFGAGITGLTAAHELAIRGFRVTIVDRDLNECVRDRTLDYGIGGIARSQYFYRQAPEDEAADATPTAEDDTQCLIDIPPAHPVTELMLDDTLVFAPDSAKPAYKTVARTFIDRLRKMIFIDHPEWIRDEDHPNITLCFADPGTGSVLADRQRYVREQLGVSEKLFANLSATVPPDALNPNWVIVIVKLDIELFPGEHGFRFFPSFYRHLFDTMKRTPILDPKPSECTSRTVFDNLVTVDELGFARGGHVRSFMLNRHPAASFEEIRRDLRLFTERLGYTLEDLARFEMMLFKYMTSCSERRERDYEAMTWSDFIELPRYSKIFREQLELGPQMMVALRGSKSDARTQGNIVTQLFRDQVVPNKRHDAILNGPTSSAWFDHWKSYLVSVGVTFKRGTVTGFQGCPAAPPREPRILPLVSYGGDPEPVDSNYFVLAFSFTQIAAMRQDLENAAAAAGIARPCDLDRIREFAGKDLAGSLNHARPNGPLQHLAGIQYYFTTEVKLWRGHTQYLDSPWCLTSISQPQLWARPLNQTDRYRSLLSVDIGRWDQPFTRDAPSEQLDTAWSLSADRIATLAWAQIRDHHDDEFYAQYGYKAKFPRPMVYALDQYLVIPNQPGTPKQNHAPYLVTEVGKYRTRPGALSDGKQQPKGQSSYTLIAGIALAGAYMQTFTRLTSMEAANESARHAVNAILDHAGAACDRCEIWDPEDHEFEDLTWFKDLDRTLFERGLPHFVETLGWSELPALLSSKSLLIKLSGDGT
jgi:hypothetical protein